MKIKEVDSVFLLPFLLSKTVFISENDSLCEIIVVVEGLVSAGMSTAKGKLLMVDYLKAGTMLAPAFVYSDECEVPVEVKTIEKSVLFCMSKDDFSLLISFCEPVRNNFIHILSHINFFLISKIRMVYMSSIKEKIATFLLRKATIMHCDSVPLSLSRRQLADVFGIHKSSLIRTLNELEHDNLIFVREKEIVLSDAQSASSYFVSFAHHVLPDMPLLSQIRREDSQSQQ